MSRAYARATAEALPVRDKPVAPRPIEDDRALGDREIMALLGISKPTLLRYRQVHGLPGPHFRIGQRSFTWRSTVEAWLAEREAQPIEYQPPMNRQRDGAASK